MNWYAGNPAIIPLTDFGGPVASVLNATALCTVYEPSSALRGGAIAMQSSDGRANGFATWNVDAPEPAPQDWLQMHNVSVDEYRREERLMAEWNAEIQSMGASGLPVPLGPGMQDPAPSAASTSSLPSITSLLAGAVSAASIVLLAL